MAHFKRKELCECIFILPRCICYNLILTLHVTSQAHYSNLLLGSAPGLKVLAKRHGLSSCQHLDLHQEGSQGWESQCQARWTGQRDCPEVASWPRFWSWMGRSDTNSSEQSMEMIRKEGSTLEPNLGHSQKIHKVEGRSRVSEELTELASCVPGGERRREVLLPHPINLFCAFG